MEKPKLSPAFNMDDIRKLRDYNSLRHKNMTADEINEELRPALEEFNLLMSNIKNEKQFATN